METGAFWYEETPVGAINGSNKTFTLTKNPNPDSSLEWEVNGQTMVATTDYSISGDTVTTVDTYPTGTAIVARYRVEPA